MQFQTANNRKEWFLVLYSGCPVLSHDNPYLINIAMPGSHLAMIRLVCSRSRCRMVMGAPHGTGLLSNMFYIGRSRGDPVSFLSQGQSGGAKCALCINNQIKIVSMWVTTQYNVRGVLGPFSRGGGGGGDAWPILLLEKFLQRHI